MGRRARRTARIKGEWTYLQAEEGGYGVKAEETHGGGSARARLARGIRGGWSKERSGGALVDDGI
eukprot:123601-Pyramimonas_sp.AAC.1